MTFHVYCNVVHVQDAVDTVLDKALLIKKLC